MTSAIDAATAREALAQLPEGTSHGAAPTPGLVYIPPSHRKAMDPDNMLVTGMRGAGKTFWWAALQQDGIRELIYRPEGRLPLHDNTEVRTGFGIRPEPDLYPDKDVLAALLAAGFEPRPIWRTVQAWQVAASDHPIRHRKDWRSRVAYAGENPEAIGKLFRDADAGFDRKGGFLLVLFDALDRCSDDWQTMYRLIRGLMQTAIEMRSCRRLRVKMFLRTDQVDEARIADFPDASKILSSAVELSWPPRELYGLLWHSLCNGASGEAFRMLVSGRSREPAERGETPAFAVPRRFVSDERSLRPRFHDLSGPFMGRDRRRGFPYTWVPNHLGDTEGRVSPRSFLKALRTAAEDTAEWHPDHEYALHFESIKHGVQEASKTRVAELREDYPWVDRVLNPLRGMTVPCGFDEIEERWTAHGILKDLTGDIAQDAVKLPPRHIDDGARGVRSDLETLGVFRRLPDGRVNIPDVFRVGYGLGRRGGVKPAR